MNTLQFLKLRKLVKRFIIESIEEDTDLPYEDTLMPDEEGEGILGGPDFSEQPQRDDYLEKKKDNVKKKKVKLHSQEETEEPTGDENTIAGGGIAGHIGPMGSDNGPGDEPYGRPMQSKNAMGDEYDE